ncbi:hypothetical protein RN70_00715 [Staphylococcus schleiferi]|uniref:WxL domain-containing protein n=1 Tax=Staphylococcus coagulans TaxID=74706 RepID=UPI00067A1049|nr:WxL domain-containing protein [Staphylococcus coagulans]AKS68171.1 hypothetical protein NP71_00655 [Staphylococcus schleiferi]AKS70400.1 hypothetical protein OA96_00545 [Staphylococcus schleiferi]AKS72550.1 hypothetical protein RN70_00715 [Staphylococcus schleiferi]MBT2832696.1 WxL domain-containing protein [Staphylococcus coagulans]
MKKSKTLQYALLATLVSTPFVLVPATNAIAAETSQATISFTAPNDPVKPVDPSDPSKPLDQGKHNGKATGESGPLTLDYVSNLDFGSHTISTAEETYQATTLSPFVQVSDRRGTGAGWNVTAQLSNFQQNGENSLPGASINLTGAEVDSTSKTPKPVPNSNITLNSGSDSSVNIVKANAKTGALNTAQGLGTWITKWLSKGQTNEKATLTIPEAAAMPGNHAATVTWTLSDGPGA